MILMDGPNTPWYAQIRGNGRIDLNPAVPNARDLLFKHYPNLVATYDAQEEAEATIDEAVKLFKAKGSLTGDEADLFTKLDKFDKKRKEGKK